MRVSRRPSRDDSGSGEDPQEQEAGDRGPLRGWGRGGKQGEAEHIGPRRGGGDRGGPDHGGGGYQQTVQRPHHQMSLSRLINIVNIFHFHKYLTF